MCADFCADFLRGFFSARIFCADFSNSKVLRYPGRCTGCAGARIFCADFLLRFFRGSFQANFVRGFFARIFLRGFFRRRDCSRCRDAATLGGLMPRASAGQGSHGCPSESDPARCHRRAARNVGFLQSRGVSIRVGPRLLPPPCCTERVVFAAPRAAHN